MVDKQRIKKCCRISFIFSGWSQNKTQTKKTCKLHDLAKQCVPKRARKTGTDV